MFSVYGPRDNPAWLIPWLIGKLHRGEVPELTPCEQIWDFLYIDDAAEAVVAALESPAAAGYSISVPAMGGCYATRLWGSVIWSGPARNWEWACSLPAGQVMHLEADVTRLREATGWRPATELTAGLEQVAEWLAKCQTSPQ